LQEKKPTKNEKEWMSNGVNNEVKSKTSKEVVGEKKRLAEMNINNKNLDRDIRKRAEEEAARKETEAQQQLQREKEDRERTERERVDRERERLAEQEAAVERERFENSKEGKEQKRQKEILLAKMKAIEKGEITLDSQPPTTRSKQAKGDDMSFGEYKPSFLTSSTTTSTRTPQNTTMSTKKSNLINDLFSNGSGDGSGMNKTEKNRSSSPTLAGFSFDDNNKVGGGGTASKNGTRVLPRRTRQPVTTVAHPGFGMVGGYDDDVEEFRM